jgi:hypothetical protein
VAETESEELDYRMNRGSDSRGNVYARQDDYDWTRSTEVGPDRRFGETLAQQEERIGREAEQARHSEMARSAHADGVDRAASSRQLTEAETGRADGFGTPADPRAYMDQETLAEVNQRAATIAAETCMSQAAASRRLAAYVSGQRGDCDDMLEAALTTHEDAREEMDTPTPIAEMSPYGYECTVEGAVTHIIDEPAAGNQYQVCYVEDDQGTSAKVTVWSKSIHGGTMVRTLREGDRVRISGGKPGEYNGTKTVAVVSDTTMCILERGDGPAPTGEGRSSFGCDGHNKTVASWRADSGTHQWANDRDMTEAVRVTVSD